MNCKSCSSFRAQEIESPTISYWCHIQAEHRLDLGFPLIGSECRHFEYMPGSDKAEDKPDRDGIEMR